MTFAHTVFYSFFQANIFQYPYVELRIRVIVYILDGIAFLWTDFDRSFWHGAFSIAVDIFDPDLSPSIRPSYFLYIPGNEISSHAHVLTISSFFILPFEDSHSSSIVTWTATVRLPIFLSCCLLPDFEMPLGLRS